MWRLLDECIIVAGGCERLDCGREPCLVQSSQPHRQIHFSKPINYGTTILSQKANTVCPHPPALHNRNEDPADPFVDEDNYRN